MPAITIARPAPGASLLQGAYRGQAILAAGGVLLLLMMIPTALAAGLDTRTLDGISVWIKPLKFQLSLAVQMLTVALLMQCLPEAQSGTWRVRGPVFAIVGASMLEIVYITLQAARGEASHYNVSTSIAALMYYLMGVGAVVIVASSVWIGVQILRHGSTANAVVFAAGLGLILGGVVGGVTGAFMSAQPGHWVGGSLTDFNGLPIFGWSRTGGDLRVAHFFGLHLSQVLPMAAWIGSRSLPKGYVRPLVLAVAITGTVFSVAVFAQAVLGAPFAVGR